jgi:hypothetical protein
MAGFVIKVNGEQVWEDKEDMPQAVSRVSLQTRRGEAGAVGVDNTLSEVDIIVETRSLLESSFSDLEELKRDQVRRDRVEKESVDAVKAGRKIMEDEAKAAEAEAAPAEVATEETLPVEEELVSAKASGVTKKAG